jgi:hypothetical protein
MQALSESSDCVIYAVRLVEKFKLIRLHVCASDVENVRVALEGNGT